MKRVLITVLIVGTGLSLASADAEKSSLMRKEAEWKSQDVLQAPGAPATQGIARTDLLTTRDINQQIEALAGISNPAKAVRVGTYRGRVTLTGFVESEGEKRQIEELAMRQVGASNVDNQLIVQPSGRS